MFKIAEISKYLPKCYDCDDVKTAADIILGITGEQEEADSALTIMGVMRHGDWYTRSDKYVIRCDNERKE